MESTTPKSAAPVLELRVVITTREFERLTRFYRQGLGLEPSDVWPAEQGRALVLDLGRATLELFDEAQAETIDRLEVGERNSGRFRLALRVPDLDAAVARLVDHGATRVGSPVVTPWGDRNARLIDPDGLHVTLFEAPEGA